MIWLRLWCFCLLFAVALFLMGVCVLQALLVWQWADERYLLLGAAGGYLIGALWSLGRLFAVADQWLDPK